MFVLRVCNALSEAGVSHALAGGYAVALHGAVRGTMDVDLVIRLKRADFEKAEAALKRMGLKPRLPVTATEVFNFREEYIRNRNLIAWSFSNPANPAEVVDILVTEDLDQCETVKIKVAGHRLSVLSVPDLVRMKTKAGRPQDIEDVAALRKLERKQ
jgi:hypothetical protein